MSLQDIGLDAILGDGAPLATTRTSGEGPHGHLPIDARMLREAPSGDLFGLTQNAGMGWRATRKLPSRCVTCRAPSTMA